MTPLIKAAQREGVLNVSGGWGTKSSLDLAAGFEEKYGIRVQVVSPGDDTSQLAAADRLDVFDLAGDSAAANTARFAPYLVFYWLEIPAGLKNGKAYWYGDCGHLMAVGYAPSARPVTALSDLLLDSYRSSIDLSGDPRSTAGLAAVAMAALANGGSAADAGPGVDFYGRLAASQNLAVFVDENPPVLIDWSDHMPAGYRTFIPDVAVEAFEAQAVNRAAQHPAAARLWEEYVFSDTGQNSCLRAGSRPSRLDAMRSDGVLDIGAAAALGPMPAGAIVLTPDELAATRAYVAAHWNDTVKA